MTSVSILLILVGVFIIINSQNIVGVLQGNKTFSLKKPTDTTTTTPSDKIGVRGVVA